ncbi:two-component response regulator-like APRR9 isoform X2 [Mercurialis annua]|uniref:two-component response regulator-like APRR9 isoform X2 n=1 Tax=Mercurialis annua TaxID=3986 RepID=UPI00215F52F5|nr:two-component response regulator-like APRR9 isoform X2 [Mercurialis annua]
MYGYNSSSTFPRADYMLNGHHPPSSPDGGAAMPSPSFHQFPPTGYLTIPDQLAGGFEVGSSTTTTTSSSYGSPSSLASCGTNLMQRSISSHSLQRNGYHNHHCHFASDFLDLDSSPVRRVFSTGDLQHQHQHGHKAESPLSSESSMIIESMSRATKYSPEEKKERIERYRSKKTQRNFNKKIKYACRKTLADSRPRIRGRFARNDEIEKNPQCQWSNNASGEEDEDYDDNWIDFLDAFSANSIP